MRANEVMVARGLIESRLELVAAAESATTERDPPVLVEDRPLQALHEAVGPGVPVA